MIPYKAGTHLAVQGGSVKPFPLMRRITQFLLSTMLLAMFGISGHADEPSPAPWLELDHGALVSQADLVYEAPVKRSVEGQPIGNGRMGTLVWTSPGAVHLQINRNDVFAVNRNHAGTQFGPDDYCSGCAGVVLEMW